MSRWFVLLAVAALLFSLGTHTTVSVDAAACPGGAIAVNTTDDTIAVNPVVSPLDGGGNISLRSGIMFANSTSGAHTICLGAATYTLTLGPADSNSAVQESGDLDILNNDLTILGVSPASTIVQAGTVKSTNGTDGNGIDRVFDINDVVPAPVLNVVLTDFTIRNGKSALAGGGIAASFVSDSFFQNTADQSVTLNNMVVRDNYTDAAGGGMDFARSASITNSTFTNTIAAGDGGGVHANSGVLTVAGSTFSSNTALRGGGIFAFFVSLTMSNSTVTGNTVVSNVLGAGSTGGGIWFATRSANFIPGEPPSTLTNVNITNNVAVGTPGSDPCPGGCGAGGGLFDGGPLSWSGGSLTGNTAPTGGGLFFTGVTINDIIPLPDALPTRIDGVTISNNTASGQASPGRFGSGNGGGIAASFNTLILGESSPVTITNNSALNGGGISADQWSSTAVPTLTMTGGSISNNSATNNGGAINLTPGQVTTLNAGSADISSVGGAAPSTRSKAVAAVAQRASMPQPILSGEQLSFTGVTITGNQADSDNSGAGDGGAVFWQTGPAAEPLVMIYNRIVNNTAKNGTAIAQSDSTVTAQENWWGCNGGPNTAGCGTTTGTLNFTPWLRFTLTANPTQLPAIGSSALTASFLTDSSNAPVAVSNLGTLINLPIAWGATNGSIVNPQNTIQASGMTTATDSLATCASSMSSVTVDNGTATATIGCTAPQVALPPLLSKTFIVPTVYPGKVTPGGTGIPVGGTAPLSFTLTNPNATQTLTGLGFTDNLPAGVIVSTPNGLSGSCGGGAISAVAGSGLVSLTGATLAGGTSCTFSVNVTGTTAGSKLNTTSAPTSNEGGNGLPATATLNVATAGGVPTTVTPPKLTKSFSAPMALLGGSVTLTFKLSNPNAAQTLTGLAFRDALPAGLVVATPNGLSGTCGGGTITATAGGGTISLAGATLAPGANCTFSVNVTATTLGIKSDVTSSVTSNEAAPGAGAAASVIVGAPTQPKGGPPASG